MKIILSFLLFTSLSIYSQKKVNNNDLRGVNKILSISDNTSTIELSKTVLDENFLSFKEDKKFEKIKLGSSEFENLDKVFVKNFVNMKYMMKASSKKCPVRYRVFMRGDNLSVCKNEKNKVDIIKMLISKISNLK